MKREKKRFARSAELALHSQYSNIHNIATWANIVPFVQPLTVTLFATVTLPLPKEECSLAKSKTRWEKCLHLTRRVSDMCKTQWENPSYLK